MFTDPPYNVVIDGHVCGPGRVRHREFAMGCGEMSEAEFTAFLQTVFERLAENTVDGSIHEICMDCAVAAFKVQERERVLSENHIRTY